MAQRKELSHVYRDSSLLYLYSANVNHISELSVLSVVCILFPALPRIVATEKTTAENTEGEREIMAV